MKLLLHIHTHAHIYVSSTSFYLLMPMVHIVFFKKSSVLLIWRGEHALASLEYIIEHCFNILMPFHAYLAKTILGF